MATHERLIARSSLSTVPSFLSNSLKTVSNVQWNGGINMRIFRLSILQQRRLMASRLTRSKMSYAYFPFKKEKTFLYYKSKISRRHDCNGKQELGKGSSRPDASTNAVLSQGRRTFKSYNRFDHEDQRRVHTNAMPSRGWWASLIYGMCHAQYTKNSSLGTTKTATASKKRDLSACKRHAVTKTKTPQTRILLWGTTMHGTTEKLLHLKSARVLLKNKNFNKVHSYIAWLETRVQVNQQNGDTRAKIENVDVQKRKTISSLSYNFADSPLLHFRMSSIAYHTNSFRCMLKVKKGVNNNRERRDKMQRTIRLCDKQDKYNEQGNQQKWKIVMVFFNILTYVEKRHHITCKQGVPRFIATKPEIHIKYLMWKLDGSVLMTSEQRGTKEMNDGPIGLIGVWETTRNFIDARPRLSCFHHLYKARNATTDNGYLKVAQCLRERYENDQLGVLAKPIKTRLKNFWIMFENKLPKMENDIWYINIATTFQLDWIM